MSADLISLLQQCRSSVKTDLNHYERLAMTIRADRPAAVEKIAAVEAEADRLIALLDAIDALREGSLPDRANPARDESPKAIEPGRDSDAPR